jgi:hypothetical protein
VVQFLRTETTTRDSISFVRAAWKLHTLPIGEALRSSNQHPLYPALVLAVSSWTRAWHPEDLPLAMSVACQLTSCLASVALSIALFFLGRELFSPSVGFWGAILFQTLPATGRLMADGLSEPVFLLLACVSLVAAIRGLSGSSPWWMLLAGTAGGLAYLTRPEGLLIPVATLAVLAWISVRQGKPSLMPRAALLLLPVMLLCLPYMVTIGKLTAKPSAEYLVDPDKWGREGLFKPVTPEKKAAIGAAFPFAEWYFGPDITPDMRWGWGVKALAFAISENYFYFGILVVALGAWAYRKKVLTEPGWLLYGLIVAILCLLCYRVAQSNGYLSSRHVVLITLGGALALAAGLEALCAPLWRPRPGWAGLAAVLLCVAACMPKLLVPLHGDRGAYRAAGEWIARNSLPGDRVWDPYAHAYYHAGRVFTEGMDGLPAEQPRVTYVVVDSSDNRHEHLFYLVKEAERLAQVGEPVCRFPAPRRKHSGEVVVYRVRQ